MREVYALLYKEWNWMGDIIGHRAGLTPDKKAIFDIDANINYTYEDLNDRANRLANYMKNELGILKGDRIAFISSNRIEMFDGIFACGKLGAVFVPYNARLSVDELTYLINNESPKVLFYEDIYRDKIEVLKSSTELKNYIELKDLGKTACDIYYEDVINYKNNSPCKCEELNPEDIYLIIHTGGTTGMPKGAMISHRAVLFNALNNVMDWGLNCKDTVHLLLPLFHTGGWNILTLALLMVGGRLIINKGFDPKLALKIINDEKPSYIFGAATIFRMMYEQPEFDTTDWSSVKWVMSGAAPTPIQVMEKFWGKGIRICAGYGLTEGGPMNLGTPMDFMSMDQIKEKYASVGKPFYFTIAKIVNDDGTETDVDEVGELIFTGPQIFSGYWNNEKETQKTMKDGWIYTGDMAKKDKDGFYYIVGRKKNMFISGGENVFPPEIEKILYEMNEIHEVSVIGVPDEKWGEVGKAVISLKPRKYLNKEDVISFLKKKLAHYKVPKYVTFVTEVPKNSVGKIVSAEVVKLHGKPED